MFSKVIRRNKFPILFSTALIALFQNCGSSNNSNASAVSATAVGPSGYSYSVTVTPTTSGSDITASIAVTVSTLENLNIQAGYYNSSGTPTQTCTQTLQGSTTTTFTCNVGSISSVTGELGLYVNIYDLNTSQLELGCTSNGVSGCSGTFTVVTSTTGTTSGTSCAGEYYVGTSNGYSSEPMYLAVDDQGNLSGYMELGSKNYQIVGNVGSGQGCIWTSATGGTISFMNYSGSNGTLWTGTFYQSTTTGLIDMSGSFGSNIWNAVEETADD